MELAIVEENKTIVPTEDYKKIASEWLTSMGMKLSENHKKQFIDICCAYGLNPIKREVYGVPYGTNNFSIIVGYESYIKRAERSNRLAGWKVEYIPSDKKAVITINRKDWSHPFVHEVFMEEYNTNQSLWKSKPITMLKKVAIAQGFRLCFSEELGGMPYTSEELPEEMTTVAATTESASPKVSDAKPKNSRKIAPNYTTEQAQNLGNVVSAKYEDGTNIFSDKEKDYYRQMLMDGKYEDAMFESQGILADRISAQIESEITE